MYGVPPHSCQCVPSTSLRFDRSTHQRVLCTRGLLPPSWSMKRQQHSDRLQKIPLRKSPSHCFITTMNFIKLHIKPSTSDPEDLRLAKKTYSLCELHTFSWFSYSSNTVASTPLLLREYWEWGLAKDSCISSSREILSGFDWWMALPSPSRAKLSRLKCRTPCLKRPKQEDTLFIAAFRFRPSKAAMEHLDLTLTTQHHLRT